MSQVLHIVFQIAAFLLFQTVLLQLVGQSKYEKYIRTFSGFLLILLLVSAIRSLVEGGNLMAEVEKRVEFATEEGDFRLRLQQAEESQQQVLQKGYEERILEEVALCLLEERYFFVKGSVSFSPEWELEEIALVVSKTWEEAKNGETEENSAGENFVGENSVIEEIWIEPVKEVTPVGQATPDRRMTADGQETPDRQETPNRQETPDGQVIADEQETPAGQAQTDSVERETAVTADRELEFLQGRLAKRLGVRQDQIVLCWKEE